MEIEPNHRVSPEGRLFLSRFMSAVTDSPVSIDVRTVSTPEHAFRLLHKLGKRLSERISVGLLEGEPTGPLLDGQDAAIYSDLREGKVIPSEVRVGNTPIQGDQATQILTALGVQVDDEHDGLFVSASWPDGWLICPTKSPTLLRVLDNNFWWRGDIWYMYKNPHHGDPGSDRTDHEFEIWLGLNRRFDRRIVTSGEHSTVKVIDGTTREEIFDASTGKPVFECQSFLSDNRSARDRCLDRAAFWLDKTCGDWRKSYLTNPWWPDPFALLNNLLRLQSDPGILRYLYDVWKNG